MRLQLRLAAICLAGCLLAPGPAPAEDISPADARRHLAALKSLISDLRADHRTEPMAAIAVAWSKTGDVDGAFELARNTKDNFVRAVMRFRLAGHHEKSGDLENALAVAREISNSYYRVRAYSSIAKAQAIAGDKVGARQSLRTAQMALPGVPKAYDLRGVIAVALFAIGEKNAAKKTIDDIENSSRTSSYLGARRPLINFVEILVKAGMTDRALSIARNRIVDVDQPQAYLRIVRRLIERGEFKIALNVAEEMPREPGWMVAGVVVHNMWTNAYARIADAQAAAGDQAGALNTIEKAFAILRLEASGSILSEAFAILAPSLAKAGEFIAAELFASLITETQGQVHTMAGIAIELAKVGDRSAARSMLRRAMIIPDAYFTPKFAKAEAWMKYFQDAFRTAKSLPTQKERAEAYKGIAQAIGEMAARSLAR